MSDEGVIVRLLTIRKRWRKISNFCAALFFFAPASPDSTLIQVSQMMTFFISSPFKKMKINENKFPKDDELLPTSSLFIFHLDTVYYLYLWKYLSLDKRWTNFFDLLVQMSTRTTKLSFATYTVGQHSDVVTVNFSLRISTQCCARTSSTHLLVWMMSHI